MMNRSIGAKIASGYVLALVLLIVFGVASYWSIDNFIKASAMSEHTFVVQGKLRNLLSALQDAETGQRGYIIVGAERYLEPYRKGISAADESFKNIRRLTSDNPNQQRRLDALEPLLAGKLAELQETIELRKTTGFDAALAMDNIKQASIQNVTGTRQAEVAAHNLHELGVKLGAMIGRAAA